MTVGSPEVTVVIPSYNGVRYLGEAIESVLAQTHRSLETVVVDDGSVDETRALVARYGDRVRYLHQENRGLAAARNTGIRAARGTYLAFLDHDDRYLPEKIARQVAVFRERPPVGLVHTGWHFIDEHGRRVGQRAPSRRPNHDGRAVRHRGRPRGSPEVATRDQSRAREHTSEWGLQSANREMVRVGA